jgi:hypothetical protein
LKDFDRKSDNSYQLGTYTFKYLPPKGESRTKTSRQFKPGNPYGGGRLSTIDLLVLTSLDLHVFELKILFIFMTKQATLMRRSTVLSLPPQKGFPDSNKQISGCKWYNRGQLLYKKLQL